MDQESTASPTNGNGERLTLYEYERVLRAYNDPVVVYPGSENILPPFFHKTATRERMERIYNHETDEMCGDLEALMYLHSASLVVGLGMKWGRLYESLAKDAEARLIGASLRIRQERDAEESQMLETLKKWIRNQQRSRYR